ncbi:MAG TPA: PfkB family carbohydrate kinase [Burkholderiaceae bacterium]|nr:PfkB family carbohydrate kinase [Burkholderiaceae bacterium]
MNRPILILGEALMDCLAQPDGSLMPLMGGSPYNLARAAARQGAQVGYLPPFSSDQFGQQLKAQAMADGVHPQSPDSACPTSLAVVTLQDGQPSYSFYREGIADRDHTPADLIALLCQHTPGVLHTGSLMLLPPEHDKTLEVLHAAHALGWLISVDTNLRPAMARDLPAYRDAVMQAVAVADWVKASDEDLLALGLGEATLANAERLRQAFAHPANRRLAFTFGAAGACLWVDGEHASAPAPTVQVVDTVGAGDTFWGTCLADWARETTQATSALPHTLARAMRAAAINCGRKGCQPPTGEELARETWM